MCMRVNCNSDRILRVNAKCSDRCFTQYGGHEKDGYAPTGVGVGGGDYIELDVCLECGTVQSDAFPVSEAAALLAMDAGAETIEKY